MFFKLYPDFLESRPPLRVAVNLPSRRPANAEPLSPNLAGFSIEMDRWPEWAGEEVGRPNPYVKQLLTNLSKGTGKPPHLRVGANSEDRAYLDLTVPVIKTTFPEPTEGIPKPEASTITIGRDFYALSANMPAGTHFTWGINFKFLNEEETVAQAKHLADTFQGSRANELSHVRLEHVEIGNEPDLYHLWHQMRGYDESWSPQEYGKWWSRLAKGVSKVLDFSRSEGGTTLCCWSTASATQRDIWTANSLLQTGFRDEPAVREALMVMSPHSYCGAFFFGEQPWPGLLMDKAFVRANMAIKLADIKAVRDEGLQYILGETNSFANHGVPGVSNTLEGAIWMVDWMLQGASLGIRRMNFHHGVGYRYNLFQPVAGVDDDGMDLQDRPHILPSYHSFLLVNEAIGDKGTSMIAELGTNSKTLAAYGIWEGGKLVRAVLIDSEYYMPDMGDRPRREVDIKGFGGVIMAKRLVGAHSQSKKDITWAGRTFDTVDGVPQGDIKEERIQGGVITLEASSVVLLSFTET